MQDTLQEKMTEADEIEGSDDQIDAAPQNPEIIPEEKQAEEKEEEKAAEDEVS